MAVEKMALLLHRENSPGSRTSQDRRGCMFYLCMHVFFFSPKLTIHLRLLFNFKLHCLSLSVCLPCGALEHYSTMFLINRAGISSNTPKLDEAVWNVNRQITYYSKNALNHVGYRRRRRDRRVLKACKSWGERQLKLKRNRTMAKCRTGDGHFNKLIWNMLILLIIALLPDVSSEQTFSSRCRP